MASGLPSGRVTAAAWLRFRSGLRVAVVAGDPTWLAARTRAAVPLRAD
jgi:hypothetical protein